MVTTTRKLFGNLSSDGEDLKLLRSVVQNLNLEFPELAHSSGHHRIIKDEKKPTAKPPTEPTTNRSTKQPVGNLQQLEMSRKGAIE
jgi:hypothetical protein